MSPASPFEILLRRMGVDPVAGRARLHAFGVRIVPVAPLDVVPLRDALAAWEIPVDASAPELVVGVTDAYLGVPAVDALVRRCRDDATPCLLVRPGGLELWIGPLLGTAEGHCWGCIQRQLSLQHPLPALLQHAASPPPALSPPPAYNASTLALGYHLAAATIAQLSLRQRPSSLAEGIVSVNVATGERAAHLLRLLSPCPDCRPTHRLAPRAPAELDRPLDEGDAPDHLASLEATRDTLAQLTSPITGLISRQSPLPTPYARGAFVISVARYAGYRSEALPHLGFATSAQASACAPSRLEAEVRAGSEAVERFSCAYQGYEPTEPGTYGDLRPAVVHPNDLLCFSERQYAERDRTNPGIRSGAAYVPAYLQAGAVIDWAPAWSLTRNQTVWVPAACCYHGFPQDGPPVALADGNGVAAGPSPRFCLRKGLYELIERDAVAIWHYNLLEKPEVDLASWRAPFFEEVRAVHAALRRELWVLDLRTDLPLHVFAAVSCDERAGTVVLGFGAHHRPEAALRSALLECSQMLPNVLAADRGSDNEAVLSVQPHHLPDRRRPRLHAANFPDRPPVASLRALVQHLQEKQVEVLYQDVTRSGTGLHVIRVMAPGLRPWYRRLAPGRLYTVPVALGERTTPRPELEMNPAEITF